MARKPASEGGVSKAQAYRDAISVVGQNADLDVVHDQILKTTGIDMPKPQISQYRNLENKRHGKLKKRGRKPKSETLAAAAAAAEPVKVIKDDHLIEFISTVKVWENKLGAAKIRKLIGALYQ